MLFGGGAYDPQGYTPSDVVDIYDTDSNTWSTAHLSQARTQLAAASVGGKVFFGGGGWLTNNGEQHSNVVDIYDTATDTWSTATLSQGHVLLAATSVGNKVFFAGGNANGGPSSVVDVYTLQNYGTITSFKAWTLVDDTNVAGRIRLSAPGSLSLGAFNLTVGSMSGDAPIDLSNGTLTAGGDNASTTYDGTISGSGRLVKQGSGALTLSANNTYTGPTTVNAGTLMVNGSIDPASAVVVQNGATLGGTGNVGGTVTIAPGGHLAPGASVGTLSVDGLVLTSGSILDFEFGPAANDQVLVTGSNGLQISGGQFNLLDADTGGPWTTPGTCHLIEYSGSVDPAGVAALTVLNPQAGQTYTFSASGGHLDLTVIPEPATPVLLIVGAIGLLAHARWWRRQ